MTKPRIQAPDISGAAQRRPTPVPGDTFAAPQSKAPDDRMGRLAQSFSVFNANLANLGGVIATDQRRAEAEAGALEAKMILAKTEFQEAARRGETGTDPHKNLVVRIGVAKGHGFAYGQRRTQEWRKELETSDWERVDVDQWVTERQKEDLERLEAQPDSKMRLLGYEEGVSSFRPWAIAEQERRRAASALAERRDIAFNMLDAKAVEMAREGNSPAEGAAAVHGLYEYLGPKGLGMPYAELDAEVINTARRMAAENPEAFHRDPDGEADGR